MAIENKRGNRSCSVFVDLQLLGLAQGRTGGSYDATHTRWTCIQTCGGVFEVSVASHYMMVYVLTLRWYVM